MWRLGREAHVETKYWQNFTDSLHVYGTAGSRSSHRSLPISL